MSDIPFVNQLGDAIDTAVARPARRTAWLSQLRSNRAAIVLVALVALSSGVALASGLLTSNSPIELATAGPMCFTSASLRDGSGPANNDLLPIPACTQTRRLLGQPARPLVACVSDHPPDGYSGVAVFPGSGSDACEHAGLKPLPAGYLSALSRVATLEASLVKLDTVGCVSPARLAARVQMLLNKGGWVSWHASLRTDPAGGPCGSVMGFTGGSNTSFQGSIYAPDRQITVFAEPYPSTLKLLHSPNGTESLLPTTGRRCYNQTAIHQLVRRWLGASSRSVRYDVSVERLTLAERARDEQAIGDQSPASGGLNDGRQRQLAAGCAVIAGIDSAPDGYNLIVDVWQGA
ncbi:MAG TPA: hypothetical protein VGP18_05515 [Solirubrobacteraceae bacterium]|jgi:hypothetical protein|nr:hypothetical protein [Solirubrobacteraceae bacterium]